MDFRLLDMSGANLMKNIVEDFSNKLNCRYKMPKILYKNKSKWWVGGNVRKESLLPLKVTL